MLLRLRDPFGSSDARPVGVYYHEVPPTEDFVLHRLTCVLTDGKVTWVGRYGNETLATPVVLRVAGVVVEEVLETRGWLRLGSRVTTPSVGVLQVVWEPAPPVKLSAGQRVEVEVTQSLVGLDSHVFTVEGERLTRDESWRVSTF
jgi:hypothetical protein